MKRRQSFAERMRRTATMWVAREEHRGTIVAPPGGWLVRSTRGWLHHRPRYGSRIAGKTIWHTECGAMFHESRMVSIRELDFVCGRCELVATEAGLPPTLIPEGVCEARTNRLWESLFVERRETP